MLGTVARIEETLIRGGLVCRYRTEAQVDGVPGDENAFLACSFWLVEQYAHSGRLDDAVALMDMLVARRSDLGLLAEQAAPQTGRQAGNTPAGAVAPGPRARGGRDRARARRGVIRRQWERGTQLARLRPGRAGPIRTPCATCADAPVHDEHGADRADRRADPVRDHVARIHGAVRHQESLPELGDDADRRAEHSGRDDAEHGRPPIDDERPEHPERQEQCRVGGELDERVARPCRDAESSEQVRGPGRTGTGRRVRRRAPARTARPRAPRRRARRSRRAIAARRGFVVADASATTSSPMHHRAPPAIGWSHRFRLAERHSAEVSRTCRSGPTSAGGRGERGTSATLSCRENVMRG